MRPVIRRATKRREMAKKNSTAGKDKAETCQASSLDRFMAKYSRAHRQMPNEYREWCKTHKG